jgi:heat-inducible transcriptional repressor
VFTELEDSDETMMYVEGTAKLLSAGRRSDISELNLLVETLERRVSMLGVLRTALSDDAAAEREVLPAVRGVSVRIGAENELPALRSVALVAAAYGLPRRPLGAVSVIGPLRMNYGAVIGAVREAASQLSTFVEGVYDER